mmetsp:Transcript_13047/g.54784  ORF Transcript_13047/g.54784 Transcript_13047/m.54784 type:complete len:717 (+) Transcript_13047:70-2220(+)
MVLLCDVPVHELSAGDKQLLQPSRNWPMHQAQCYAHLRCGLRLVAGARYLLLGKNGCGKSTLLKAIHERELPDWPVHVTTHLVAQGSPLPPGDTPVEAVLGADEREASLLAEAEMIERALEMEDETEADEGDGEGESGSGADATYQRLCDVYEELEMLGAEDAAAREARAMRVLRGMGLTQEQCVGSVRALSGGWKMRVALAAALFVSPRLLLLDEPTNHLDAAAKEYLRGWLQRYRGTALIVSHDEQLLERGVDRLVEVRAARLHGYSGNYARFLSERAERRKVAAAAAAKETKKAQKLEAFVAKNSARASTAAAARSRAKQLVGVRETLEGLLEDASGGNIDENDTKVGPGDAKRVTLKLPDPPACARECLVLENATVGYDARAAALFSGASLSVNRGDRVLVVGPNGAGKSTLLRALAGAIRCREGVLKHGQEVRVGYFSQDLAQELPAEEPPLTHVLRVARAANPTVTAQTARAVLGALGLTGNAAVDRTIGDLSGGEKARVALAAFVLRPVNVLLLDEASNHLDAAALDALTEALRGWDGAVVAVTHNKQFAEALEPTQVVRVEAGRVAARQANGSLSKKDFSPDAAQTGGVAGAVFSEETRCGVSETDALEAELSEEAQKAARAEREKLLREARNAPKTIDKIERALAVLEQDIEAIDARMLACGSDVSAAQEVQLEKDAKTAKQDLYMAEWERLEGVMEQAELILAEEA